MKGILELLHPLCFIMGIIGILMAIIELWISRKMIWIARQVKNSDPHLFEIYHQEIYKHLKNTRSTIVTTIILLVLTVFIHISIM